VPGKAHRRRNERRKHHNQGGHHGREAQAAAHAADPPAGANTQPVSGVAQLRALEQLQAELLTDLAPEMATREGSDYEDLLLRAVARAEADGHAVLGAGSSRMAVETNLGVAKLAYDYRGLVWNLQEAAAWLVLPRRMRAHLAPGVVLAPGLVLVQERVEPLSPTLIESLRRDTSTVRAAAVQEYADAINGAWVAFGFGGAGDTVRLDNWGLHEGRVVTSDYGEIWRPLEPVWAWLLHRLREGPSHGGAKFPLRPVRLDRAERARLYRAFGRREVPGVARPTVLALAERAGLRPPPDGPCPCGSRDVERFADCARECGFCGDATDVVALYTTAPELPRSMEPPRTVQEAVLRAAGVAGGGHVDRHAGGECWRINQEAH
jgi:hypothetical protein